MYLNNIEIPGYSGAFEIYFRGHKIWSKKDGQGILKPKDMPGVIDKIREIGSKENW